MDGQNGVACNKQDERWVWHAWRMAAAVVGGLSTHFDLRGGAALGKMGFDRLFAVAIALGVWFYDFVN